MINYNNAKQKNWDDIKDRITYLKEVIDPVYLLESLGFEITKETTKELRASCKIHGGDNTTGFRFNKENKSWVCFTRRCHEVFGSDIVALVRSINGCSFMDAIGYLEGLCGYVEKDNGSLLMFKRKREREVFVDRNFKNINIPNIVNEDELSGFRTYGSSRFVNENFSKEILDFFEIGGGYVGKDRIIRDVVPIRDVNNNLVAYSLRDIRDNVSYDNKYILTYNFNKDKVIYNLNNVKKIANYKPLIVVEGFKSVWRLKSYGIDNVVAVMGSYITSGQISLLCSYALNGIVIMFDNDKAGVVGALSSYESIKHKFPVNIVFITEIDKNGNGLDPSDLTKEQVYDYLKKYI